MNLRDISNEELQTIKSSYKLVEFDNEDESEKKKIEDTFRIANKSPIDSASLFVYTYDLLLNINNDNVRNRLKELKDIYSKINSELQEYNRPIEYGKHYYYNAIKEIVSNNIEDVKEIIDFAFIKILLQENLLGQIGGRFK